MEHVCVMKLGKYADMAYMYPLKCNVLIMDIPRQKLDSVDYIYSFLESVKDGRLFSPKYESYTKRFPSLHVIVMMNRESDMEALSADRYDVFNLDS